MQSTTENGSVCNVLCIIAAGSDLAEQQQGTDQRTAASTDSNGSDQQPAPDRQPPAGVPPPIPRGAESCQGLRRQRDDSENNLPSPILLPPPSKFLQTGRIPRHRLTAWLHDNFFMNERFQGHDTPPFDILHQPVMEPFFNCRKGGS